MTRITFLIISMLSLTGKAAPYLLYLDQTSELQVVDLATGAKQDTRIKISGDFQVSGDKLVFLDSVGELQIVDLATGAKIDTRLKVAGPFKITP